MRDKSLNTSSDSNKKPHEQNATRYSVPLANSYWIAIAKSFVKWISIYLRTKPINWLWFFKFSLFYVFVENVFRVCLAKWTRTKYFKFVHLKRCRSRCSRSARSSFPSQRLKFPCQMVRLSVSHFSTLDWVRALCNGLGHTCFISFFSWPHTPNDPISSRKGSLRSFRNLHKTHKHMHRFDHGSAASKRGICAVCHQHHRVCVVNTKHLPTLYTHISFSNGTWDSLVEHFRCSSLFEHNMAHIMQIPDRISLQKLNE